MKITTTTITSTTTLITTTTSVPSKTASNAMCPMSSIQSFGLSTNHFKEFEHISPVWEFTDGGNIYQGANTAAGVAVGDLWFTDVEYEGTITVETDFDPDFVGVVFAYQVMYCKNFQNPPTLNLL